MASRRVLLVDDNPDDVALAERALRRSGVQATMDVARSGKEAWSRLSEEALSEGAPHAVFLDLNMAEWNGFEVLKRLRHQARTRNVPVVILTTSKEPSDISRCYDLGANSYVTKPVDFVEFTDVFSQMIRYWVELNQPAAL